MTGLFLYGTLRHPPMLEIVLGRPAEGLDTAPAQLADHEVVAVTEGPFPMIRPRQGATAHGVVLRGLRDGDVARLDFYEGCFAYDLVSGTLANGSPVDVYLPQSGNWTPSGPWSLEEWAEKWGSLSCEAAREVMAYFGKRPPEDVGRMFPMIRRRAQSRLNAARSRHGAGTMKGAVKIEHQTRSYAKFFALDDMRIQFERFDGSLSDPADRAVFIAADAAIVLPYDPVRDRVLLVEQMRMGPLGRGDRSVWQLEPVAGHIDPGETPLEAAVREAREEAGIRFQSVEPIAEVYASPGNSTEFYYIFLGIADLPDRAEGIGGLDTEGEDIRSHVISFDALMDLVDGFGAANAPLAVAALWLARHRDRLRSTGAGDTPEGQ